MVSFSQEAHEYGQMSVAVESLNIKILTTDPLLTKHQILT